MPDLTPISTQKVSTIEKHVLTQAQYEQLVNQGYVSAHPYEEYYITDSNGDLNDLDDVNITSPTNGQGLVYDSTTQKWINGAGGGGIQTLTSPVRIWSLEPGLYYLPASSSTIYYYGETSSNSFTAYDGILHVWWGYGTTVKRWDCWGYPGSSSSYSSTPYYRYYGSTTSSSGTYTGASYLTSQRSASNSGSYDFGHYYYDNLTNFNTASNYLLASGSCRGYMSSSCSNKPVNLTLSSNTYFHLFVHNSYSNTSYTNVSGYYIRQDLFLPTLNKHYYRLIQYYNSTITPNTSITGADSAGWVEVFEAFPSFSGNAGKVLKVNSGANGVEWGDAAAAIADLTDVTISSLSNGQMLQYNSNTAKWVNTAVPSGTVPSPSTSDTYLYSPDGVNMGWASIGSIAGHDFTHQTDTGTPLSGSLTVTYAAYTRGSRTVTAGGNLGIDFVVNNSSDNYLWIINNTGSTVDIAINSVSWNGSPINNVFRPEDGISVDNGYVCEIGIIVNNDGANITNRSDLILQTS